MQICAFYFCFPLKAEVGGEGSKYFISTERLAGHCPVHGCKEIKQNMKKTFCKTAVDQNVRTTLVIVAIINICLTFRTIKLKLMKASGL